MSISCYNIVTLNETKHFGECAIHIYALEWRSELTAGFACAWLAQSVEHETLTANLLDSKQSQGRGFEPHIGRTFSSKTFLVLFF